MSTKQNLNFSPYQPPPDTPSDPSSPASGLLGGTSNTSSSNGKKAKRPWFTRDASSFVGSGSLGGSYQSGGLGTEPSSTPQYLSNDPSLSNSGGGQGGYIQSNGQTVPPESTGNGWESRFGWRIDVLAAVAYLGGPITALLLLILETTNDYVRFHAYQSALLTTPLLIVWFLMLILHFWRWLRILYGVISLLLVVYTAFRAFHDPSSSSSLPLGGAVGGIRRFYLPVVGDLADRWVGEE